MGNVETTTGSNMISSILKTVTALAKSWYTVDRIRVSPTTGRLLHLNVGDSVVFRNELYSVLKREIDSDNDHGQVTYLLTDSEYHANLTVPVDGNSGTDARLVRNSGSCVVFDSDVVIRRSSARR